MKSKNSIYVDNWRAKKGNRIRKSRYDSLREIGIDYKQASKMRYWSIDRIKSWIKKNGYDVADFNG